MIPLIMGIAGAIWGWMRAAKRGGNTLDKLQYAAGHGIAFLVLGLFIGIVIVRTAPPM